MNCDNCGHPIDREETQKGTCTQCGAVLPYVVRAAEKAEFVRRVVEQGGAVRIIDDRVESILPRPPPPVVQPFRWDQAQQSVRAAVWMSTVFGGVLFVAILAWIASNSQSHNVPSPPIEPMRERAVPTPTVATPASTEQVDVISPRSGNAPTASPKPRRGAPVPSPSPSPPSVSNVIAAHQAAFARCKADPEAPRRYSLAITVGPAGKAEWVEVLSEASEAMKACLASVVRGLDFPKPSEGSARSIATLSLPSS